MYRLDCLSKLSFFGVQKIDAGLVSVSNHAKGTLFYYEGHESTKLHFLVRKTLTGAVIIQNVFISATYPEALLCK